MTIVRAQAGLARPAGQEPAPSRRPGLALLLAAAFFLLALGAYFLDVRVHTRHHMLTWFDLGVYNDAGGLVRHTPGQLYTWRLAPSVKFTYTPFAGVLFAGTSMLAWPVLRWSMTILSLVAVPLTGWLTFGAMGWQGSRRAAASLAVGAAGLWTEPVQRALHLGQIEPALMLLVVWDLCQPDSRWWKGAGIGLAAGIKLVPLIFIPYLLLAGKWRQAAVAAAAFGVSAGIGFAALPKVSADYWLTGYFLRPGNTGSVGGPVNQSLLGFLTRIIGTLTAAHPVWLVVAVITGVLGLSAAALLHRSGWPVQGWVLCALTGVLVSPISWDHHWVWILPVLAVGVDWAYRARRDLRWTVLALTAAVWGLFGGWPGRFTGPWAFIPEGLLGFFVNAYPKPPPGRPAGLPPLHASAAALYRQVISSPLQHVSLPHVWDLRGIQLLSWNLFVLAGMAIYAALTAAAVIAWRARRRA